MNADFEIIPGPAIPRLSPAMITGPTDKRRAVLGSPFHQSHRCAELVWLGGIRKVSMDNPNLVPCRISKSLMLPAQ